MVLQRNHLNPIWGWAEADEPITVSIAGQSHKTKADEKGHWEVTLDPMVASAKPKTLSVKGKSSSLSYANVLVGEVWLCSGQSNMGWAVNSSDDSDLEIMTANFPELRVISIPQVGTQEPQGDFNGQWEATTPEVAKNFSAVGYFFGRRLHQAPGSRRSDRQRLGWVGLRSLDPSRPSQCYRRDKPYMDLWRKTEANYDPKAEQEKYEKQKSRWTVQVKKAGGRKTSPSSRPQRNPMTGQHRPTNLYNGVLKPIIGYGIKRHLVPR